ncbi:MAG: PspA/IM30 family protein [Proteobacteria bacterium]|nr:PspA/IM30 family protein [Pseudomonadota bacterium]
MAGFFQRLFKVAESEAHSAVSKLEDPIKMTEQGIRDLRKDLDESMKSLAQVKALQIRMRRDLESNKDSAATYEKKAMLLVQKGQGGSLAAAEADRLATEALAKRDQASGAAAGLVRELGRHDAMVAQLEGNVRTLRSKISSFETELTTLKARAKVAGATKKLNKQLAQVDSSGTIAMLERMKERVVEDEALAASYGELASVETSVDAEIDKALASGTGSDSAASDSLAALKAKMGAS